MIVHQCNEKLYKLVAADYLKDVEVTKRFEIENVTKRIEEETKRAIEVTKQKEIDNKIEEERSKRTELINRRVSMIMEHPRISNEVAADRLVEFLERMSL